MASSRPSRVSKTTALLLNKVATGTLEEFLGVPDSDLVFPLFSDEVEDVQPKKGRPRENEEESSSFSSSTSNKKKKTRSSSSSESSDSDSSVVTSKVATVVKKPVKKNGKTSKPKPKKTVVQNKSHSARSVTAPTRQLPLRKSLEKRSVGEGIALGDYVRDDKLSQIVHRLKMADHDKDLRRDGDDPDPNAKRIWDTSCHVLGRGLIVARSKIPNAGFGLFSTQDFEKGVLVTEYVGEEVTKERAFELRDLKKDQYVRSLKNGFCIDGNPWPAIGESCAQMANDGRSVTANNCAFVAIHNRDKVQEKPRVYLKTLQFIPAGSELELLASYGKRYWEFHSNASNGDDDEDNEEEQVHEVEIHVEDGGIIEVLSE